MRYCTIGHYDSMCYKPEGHNGPHYDAVMDFTWHNELDYIAPAEVPSGE